MDKSRVYAGLAVMVGLMVLGFMIPAAVGKLKASERTVTVKGLCEKEVAADKVIWPLKYKVVGNDLSAVYGEIESKNATVMGFLKDGGISEDEITVTTPSISDKYTQEYGSNDRTYRFVASSTVTVCTKEVDKVLSLMKSQDFLLRKGIAPESDWDCKPSFTFEGLNGIKPDMIQAATQNARAVADKFAADSHSRLGKIKTANQGSFSIEDRDSNTPQIKKVRVVTGIVYYLNK